MICRTSSIQTESKDGDQTRKCRLLDKQTEVSYVRYTLILWLCNIRGMLNCEFRSHCAMPTDSTNQHISASLPTQDLQETLSVSILTPKPTSRLGVAIRHSLISAYE